MTAASTDVAILRAAAALIAERGYHGASMRDIARAVGLQMASLYHHFGSKQELLVLIMREAMHDLTSCVEASVDAAGDDPGSRLAAAMRAHVRFHTERRPEVIVADAELRALEEPGRTEIVAMRDRHQALFREPIEQLGVAQPGVVTSAVVTMCTDVALWYRDGGGLDADGVADTFIGLVFDGIDLTRTQP
jgi:AcrR family transcriptional regulator